MLARSAFARARTHTQSRNIQVMPQPFHSHSMDTQRHISYLYSLRRIPRLVLSCAQCTCAIETTSSQKSNKILILLPVTAASSTCSSSQSVFSLFILPSHSHMIFIHSHSWLRFVFPVRRSYIFCMQDDDMRLLCRRRRRYFVTKRVSFFFSFPFEATERLGGIVVLKQNCLVFICLKSVCIYLCERGWWAPRCALFRLTFSCSRAMRASAFVSAPCQSRMGLSSMGKA